MSGVLRACGCGHLGGLRQECGTFGEDRWFGLRSHSWRACGVVGGVGGGAPLGGAGGGGSSFEWIC